MLPFMAQGHIIPFLSLAKHIQQSTNFSITIATTPLNIKSLQSTISFPHPITTSTWPNFRSAAQTTTSPLTQKPQRTSPSPK
ncbi:hypothetical protein ACFX1R_033487 [Malus domestica]